MAVSFQMAFRAAAASAVMAGACPAPSLAETLNEALAAAYRYNPQLDAERARLRATDEDVPIARSGYLPKIEANADINWRNTNVRPDCRQGPCSGQNQFEQGTNYPKGYSVDLTQNVFKGFQIFNAVNVAEANVRAGREKLRGVEQGVLFDAVTFYMNVVSDQAVVRLYREPRQRARPATQGDRGPVLRRRGDAHRRRPVAGAARGRRLGARLTPGRPSRRAGATLSA